MGPPVAMDCAEIIDGPTLWEAIFYTDIIDRNLGGVLSDGECGVLFFQAEDGIRVRDVTGVQTCALPIVAPPSRAKL